MTATLDIGPTSALFYNIWGGRYEGALHQFLRRHASNLDVLCLTEVTTTDEIPQSGRLYTSLRENEPMMPTDCLRPLIAALPDFESLFHSKGAEPMKCERTQTVFEQVRFGSALFWRRELQVVMQGADIICRDQPGRLPRILQWLVYNKGGSRYLVAHLHGMWIEHNTKGDHPARTQQSREVREHLAAIADEYHVKSVVFGGDLNLALETEALALLIHGPGSDMVFKNLITEHDVKSTRTAEYRKHGVPGESMHADYVLISPEVVVHEFEVFTHVRASDHAPLIIKFS